MKIFEILKKYNIEPDRRRGQNFLIDNNILEKIVNAAKLKTTDNILEVGPGAGVLTEKLIAKAKKVVAVELDKSLYYVLKQEFREAKNLELIKDDILDLHEENLKKLFNNEKYKIVANLPYNITSFFLRKFLELFEFKPAELILLVQKEVAERLTAKPKKMNLLAISVQFFTQPEIIDHVSKNCFFPKPKVDSAIIRLKMKDVGLKKQEIKQFFRIVKIGFSAKRKQLLNNLINGLGLRREKVAEALKEVGLKTTVRAQELSLADWEKLSRILS